MVLTPGTPATLSTGSGTVSAVNAAALPKPPRSTMVLGREGGVQAVCSVLAILRFCVFHNLNLSPIDYGYRSMHPSNVYTSQLIVCLKMVVRHYLEAPHVVEMSPAVVACSPRDAGAKVV